MIDYTKESKMNVKSAVEKLTKDLMDNKWGVLSVIDVKNTDRGKTKVSLYNPTVALSTASSISGYDKLNRLAAEAEDALKRIVDMQVWKCRF